MINSNLILPHIFFTFGALFVGIYLFYFSSKKFEAIKGISFTMAFFLIMAASTGLLLNTKDFTPFHFLSVVTLTTTPFAIFQLFKGLIFEYLGGLFYNFLGLTVAFAGALEPSRVLGYRLFIKNLNLELNLAQVIFSIIFISSIINAIIMVLMLKKKKFELLK